MCSRNCLLMKSIILIRYFLKNCEIQKTTHVTSRVSVSNLYGKAYWPFSELTVVRPFCLFVFVFTVIHIEAIPFIKILSGQFR